MKSIISTIICLLFFNLVQAQNALSLDIRYPQGYAEFDNITFATPKVELQTKHRMPYDFYSVKGTDWDPGQMFQMLVQLNTLPSGHYYFFGVNRDHELSVYYPITDRSFVQLTEKGAPRVFPSVRRGANVSTSGKHQMCLLYSPTEILNWEEVAKEIGSGNSGDIQYRVMDALGNKLMSASKINYDNNALGYKIDKCKKAIPLFFDVYCNEVKKEEAKGNLYMLSVGVKHVNLQYTEKDAEEIANFFKKNEKGVYNKVVVESLTGEQATSKNILRAVEKIIAQNDIKEEDKFVLFVSSNGYLHNDELYIQGRDYDMANPDMTTISYTDIYQSLKDVAACKVILLDLSASQAMKKNEPIVYTPESPIKPLPEDNFFTVLSNCKGEYSWEDEAWENGAFTEAIIEGLSGEADEEKDGRIRLSELYSYVSNRTHELVDAIKGKRQTPVLTREEFVDHDFFAY